MWSVLSTSLTRCRESQNREKILTCTAKRIEIQACRAAVSRAPHGHRNLVPEHMGTLSTQIYCECDGRGKEKECVSDLEPKSERKIIYTEIDRIRTQPTLAQP